MAGDVRLDVLVHVGAALSEPSTPVDPAWNDGSSTYTAARTRTQSFLFELTGSWRAGVLELWAGAGVHVTQVQLAAEYDALRCTDLLCLGPKVPVHETDWTDGSFVTRPILSAGVRIPFLEHWLVGLEARELFPGTSRVSAFAFSRTVGGFSVTAGLTLRFGGRLERG